MHETIKLGIMSKTASWNCYVCKISKHPLEIVTYDLIWTQIRIINRLWNSSAVYIEKLILALHVKEVSEKKTF